jgi:hypothetical protein
LSFSPETSSFSVYRGKNPSQLYRIAAAVGVANQFTDTGAVAELAGPPDENYDHANFYWRLEQQSEAGATVHGATTLGNEGLQMPANGYRGAVVRITKGKGAGQERSIVANTATVATVAPAWEIVPDATSFFVIAESGWRFGAMGYGSPIEFDVPNREGATVHISGRSANVNDKECAYELSPLTRWQIGGSAGSGGDSDVPPEPTFGITPAGQGTIELLGIGFDELTNTRSVTAGTLTIWYWDELAGTPATTLSTGIDSGVTTVDLSAAGGAGSADAIQIDSEVMVVLAVLNGGLSYDVERAGYGSQAAMHAADVKIYHLKKKTLVVPFVKEFFGSPASGSYAYPIYLPNARIAAVELFVTNSRGNSPTARKHFTATIDRGIRTLSGGQLSMQVEGNLAIQMNAVPPLIVEDPRAIRDLFATVSEAPLGASIDLELRQNGTLLCPALTIPTGSTESATVNGFGLGPLIARGELTLDIVSVGTDAPGRDLTVTIRL